MIYRFYSKPILNVRVFIIGEWKDSILKIAVARCSHKDQFVRKTGRDIAEERLVKNKLYLESKVLTPLTSKEFISMANLLSYLIVASKKVYCSEVVVEKIK